MEQQVEVKVPSVKELPEIVVALMARIEVLEAKLEELTVKPAKVEPKEMTKDDARRILNGDLKDKKHKDAAEVLGLTYGQVYSCRLEFTFKDIHKELRNSGWKNTWVK